MNTAEEENQLKINVPTIQEIKAKLDEYVIGQDDAKRVLSIAAHHHYRRIQALYGQIPDNLVSKYKNVEIEKSNICLISKTGTGKTHLCRTLAKIIGVPFAIADATTLTAAGYVGEDVENVIRYLWQSAGYDVEMTQIGIVVIDEIDKLASKTQNVSITKDVGGTEVQNNLLKIIEGTCCRFPPNGGRKHPDQALVEVDTTNILFIGLGSFDGIDNIIAERNDKQVIGFKKDQEEKTIDNDILPEDLIKFGLTPEFVGRLPILVKMKDLTEDDLVKILTEPKNAITKQYQKLLALDGIDLVFKSEALKQIAKISINRKAGARGLRATIEKIISDLMFSIDENSKKIIITKKMVDGKLAE